MSEFILSITSTFVASLTALVPNGEPNGFRELNFKVEFESLDVAIAKTLPLTEAAERCVKSVDFGNLKVNVQDLEGNQLAPRDVALRNVFTRNEIIRYYRDEIMSKGLDAKNSKTSPGR